MRRDTYDDRFGFLYTKYSPFVAEHHRIEFYKRPPKNWGYALEILLTDKFSPHRWDETLLELHQMGIGDFGELIGFEEEPAENEYDLDRKEYCDLMFFDAYLLDTIEWQDALDRELARRRLNAEPPLALDDDDDEEEEMPEESWDELWQVIYRCEKEEEAKEREGLPDSFGGLMSTILTRY